MAWWLIPIGLIVMSMIAYKAKWGKKGSGRISCDGEGDWLGWLAASIFTGLIVLIFTLIVTGQVVSHQAGIDEARRNLEASQHRYDVVRKEILQLTNKYPMEEDFLKALKVGIVLKLPELNSSTFLDEQIKKISDLQQAVYSWHKEINYHKRCLDWHRQGWLISPNLAFFSTTYENLATDSAGVEMPKPKRARRQYPRQIGKGYYGAPPPLPGDLNKDALPYGRKDEELRKKFRW